MATCLFLRDAVYQEHNSIWRSLIRIFEDCLRWLALPVKFVPVEPVNIVSWYRHLFDYISLSSPLKASFGEDIIV